jgi:glycosyltransferase involved in cell wall biosynthesis
VRILLVSQYCILGGAETFMLSLTSAFAAAGHECDLFFFQHGQLEQYIPADYVVHFGDLADCLRLIAVRRYDVVHARSSDWSIGLSATRRAGTKLVITTHGFLSLGWNADNCDAYAACSRWLADEQQILTDIPIKVVLNGIDTVRFSPAGDTPASSPPIVAWVGRGIETRKRIDTFAAIAPVLRRGGIRLWVVDPYGAEAVTALYPAAGRELAALAEFWGRVPIEKMPGLYRDVAASGGCVVSTASWEGLPLTLLEAQACGCPVIAPDVPGTNECVHPLHGGVLYPLEMDDERLADLVLQTVRDTDRMTWRRTACRQYMEAQFTVKRMADDYVRIYQEAPYPPNAAYLTRARRRLLLSPLRHWDDYVAHRRTVAVRQYEVSRKLAREREWKLARAAARASLMTGPTIYMCPKRMAFLARVHLSAA